MSMRHLIYLSSIYKCIENTHCSPTTNCVIVFSIRILITRTCMCKRLRSPGIDSKESIPPAYVAWRTGTTNRVVVPTRQGIDSGLLKRFTSTGAVFACIIPAIIFALLRYGKCGLENEVCGIVSSHCVFFLIFIFEATVM
jgi:hypothetical protein